MSKSIYVVLSLFFLAGCGSSPESSNSSQPSSMTTQMSSSAQSYMNQGLAYLKEAKIPEAIHSLDEAIKQNPMDPEGYMVLGQTYMHLKQFDRAIDTFSAATRVAPNFGEAYYMLALNHQLSGNTKEAVENAQISVAIFKNDQDEKSFEKAAVLYQSLVNVEDENIATTEAP